MPRLFEVWNLSLQPPSLEARFRSYDEAASFVERQALPTPFDIRHPDGRWGNERARSPKLVARAASAGSAGLDDTDVT